MLKEIPYRTLKQNQRAYEIMLQRDQCGSTFAAIAKGYGVTAGRIVQLYRWSKIRQMQLYANRIAIALGHPDTSQIRAEFFCAKEWYQDIACACAYLEQKYQEILDEYRDGEPGMPQEFLAALPPLKSRLSEETVARVVGLREGKNASFAAIAEELGLTRAKAKHVYQMFYHRQVMAHIQSLEDRAKNGEERWAIRESYFRINKSPKKRYDLIMEEKRRLAMQMEEEIQ